MNSQLTQSLSDLGSGRGHLSRMMGGRNLQCFFVFLVILCPALNDCKAAFSLIGRGQAVFDISSQYLRL